MIHNHCITIYNYIYILRVEVYNTFPSTSIDNTPKHSGMVIVSKEPTSYWDVDGAQNLRAIAGHRLAPAAQLVQERPLILVWPRGVVNLAPRVASDNRISNAQFLMFTNWFSITISNYWIFHCCARLSENCQGRQPQDLQPDSY